MFPLCPPKRDRLWLVPEVGIAPTSPPLQGGANLPQLLGGAKFAFLTLVVPHGNAPRSSGYQPDALLLSYRTMKVNREAPLRSPLEVVDVQSKNATRAIVRL